MPTNYNNIRAGSRLVWNDRMGPTYRRHTWQVTIVADHACVIYPVSADGTRLLTNRRIASRETIERFGTIVA